MTSRFSFSKKDKEQPPAPPPSQEPNNGAGNPNEEEPKPEDIPLTPEQAIPKWGEKAQPGKKFEPPPVETVSHVVDKVVNFPDHVGDTHKNYECNSIIFTDRHSMFSIEEQRFFDYIYQKVIDAPIYPPVPTQRAQQKTVTGAGGAGASQTQPNFLNQAPLTTTNARWDYSLTEFPHVDKFEVPTSEKYFIPLAHVHKSMDTEELAFQNAPTMKKQKNFHYLFEVREQPKITTNPHKSTEPIKINSLDCTVLKKPQSLLKIDHGGRTGTNTIRVEREGVGQINFFYVSDNVAIDPDDFITIDNCFIDLFKTEKNKDTWDILNGPALITLYRVWPRDSNGIRTRNSHLEQYERLVKQYLEENKHTFISYDPQNGTLVFRVKNFKRSPIKIP